jgi:hypothetical protein
VTRSADALRLRSVLTLTESSTGSVLHSRCPDILLVPHLPRGVRGGCSMSARIGMPRTGRVASAVRPHRDRFQKTGLAGVMRRRGFCSFTGESGIGCVVLRV